MSAIEMWRTAVLGGHFQECDIEGPTLLKIDVQGTELEVLRGGVGLLRRVDCILVECSFVPFYEGQTLADDVVVFLREHGFRLRGVFSLSMSGDGRCLQADLLFAR